MTGCLQFKIAWLSIFAIFAPLFVALTAPAAEPRSSTVDRDDWIICTRHLPAPKNQHSVCNQMRYWKREGGTWRESSAQHFSSTLDPQTTVCVFVDGNRIEADEAEYRGKILRRKIDDPNSRMRYVIWSWPSDQIRGPVRDARAKIERANGDAYYLASWMTKLPARQPTALVGYSLGARTVSGAIHMLEGGTFDTNSVGGAKSPVCPRILFFGAAIPNRWLRECGQNSLLLHGTDRILSIYNSEDKVLRWFKYDHTGNGGVVLGNQPIASQDLGPYESILEQRDVAPAMDKNHGLQYYVDATGDWVISRFIMGYDRY